MSNVKYLSDSFSEFRVSRKPLEFHLRGVQQTQTGYGSRLTSQYMVSLIRCGRRVTYRVYYTCYSNVASHWVTIAGKRYYLRDGDLDSCERTY